MINVSRFSYCGNLLRRRFASQEICFAGDLLRGGLAGFVNLTDVVLRRVA